MRPAGARRLAPIDHLKRSKRPRDVSDSKKIIPKVETHSVINLYS